VVVEFGINEALPEIATATETPPARPHEQLTMFSL
jgi:hypothetical protein